MSKHDEQEFDRWHTWPEWAKDALVVDTEVYLSWGDAFRALWHRRLTVTSKTFTRVVIGEQTTLSRVHVPPFRQPPPLGVVTASPEPPRKEPT